MVQNKKVNISNILKIIFRSLLILFVATILIGWLAGYKAYIVNGGSMEPIIHYRSLAVDKKPSAQNIKIGDAITYKVGSGFITHRLTKVKNNAEVTIAEFRDFADYDVSWEEGEAYYEDRSDLGVNVVIWYSGIEFDEQMIFITRATNNTANPLDSTATEETIAYSQIHGVVAFSIPGFGNFVLFIQKNIILIIATFVSLLLLYNMIYAEMHKKK